MNVTAVITSAPEGGFTALNPETGTVSQGDTIEEAVDNLREAVGAFLREFPMAATGPAYVTTFSIPEHA